jgi:hypothetical protein
VYSTISTIGSMGIREERLEAGLCYRCSERRVPGRRLCQKHLDADKARKKGVKPKAHWKVAWQSRIDQGLCPICGTEAEAGFKMCELCREERRAYKKSRREKAPDTSDTTNSDASSTNSAASTAGSDPDTPESTTPFGPALRVFG